MKKIGSLIFIGFMMIAMFLPTSIFADEVNVEGSPTSYYISPNGSDNNPGTESEPFKSLMKAQSEATFGDTVYIRGGIYNEYEFDKNTDNPHESVYHFVHDINKSGITYMAYPGDERPVFDFSDVPTDQRIAGFYIGEEVTDVSFIGFDVTGIKVGSQKQAEAFRINGQAYFENMAVYNNEANGFYFTGGKATGLVYNSDAYDNIGPTNTSAGNIDGFGAHALDVAFINNRAWNNSDDGFDSISSTGSVIHHGNWSFNHNGNQDGRGDKNGFKVGGYSYRTEGLPNPMPVHSVTFNLAVNNGGNNFYANHQPGKAADWINNTAYKPGYGANFNMLERLSPTSPEDIPGYREVLHNNIAYFGQLTSNYDISPENETNNSWTIDGGLEVTAEDFVSLDMEQLKAPRKPDGTLPDVTFMEIKPTSPLYNYNLGYLAHKDESVPLQRLVTVFTDYGKIDNKGIANSLQQQLENQNYTAFINHVEAQSGKHVDKEVARVLVQEAKALISK
ncbi:right-handed parallel beta-helix repeat-containing protein [Bacillus sinesaloumensis]|uniref:right-handed parallel beta-helix repeat-containing protein n=1 Tax=Litchfieldia sinesaloumensis TaxID=1926280 RepID=UPI0009884800|nr:DUF4990 domain-containing protein [Bacillus sinesaloumensis]